MGKVVFYTKFEDDIILDKYGKISNKEIADIIFEATGVKRTESAIKHRANRLGKYIECSFNEDEDNFIINYYPTTPSVEIIDELVNNCGKTRAQVEGRIEVLRIKHGLKKEKVEEPEGMANCIVCGLQPIEQFYMKKLDSGKLVPNSYCRNCDKVRKRKAAKLNDRNKILEEAKKLLYVADNYQTCIVCGETKIAANFDLILKNKNATEPLKKYKLNAKCKKCRQAYMRQRAINQIKKGEEW